MPHHSLNQRLILSHSLERFPFTAWLAPLEEHHSVRSTEKRDYSPLAARELRRDTKGPVPPTARVLELVTQALSKYSGISGVQGHPQMHDKCVAGLSYMKPCFKTKVHPPGPRWRVLPASPSTVPPPPWGLFRFGVCQQIQSLRSKLSGLLSLLPNLPGISLPSGLTITPP